MKALIFAAGLGTRMRPLTDNLPKALLPLGDGTMLSEVIERLKKAGVNEFVVNAHHFADKIAAYLDENSGFGAAVSVSIEKEKPLETGGGIKKARKLLEGDGRFLVHNVDIMSNLDIPEFIGKSRTDALATLVVSERETKRYFLFDRDMRLCGWTNVETGEVKSPYPGLDVTKCRKLAFGGIHIISDNIFPLLEKWPEAFSITDFYISVCKDCPIYGYVQDSLVLTDIGKKETYFSVR